MPSLPQRAATALFTAVVLFYTSTVTITVAEDCVSYTSSTTAGYPEEVSSIALPTYFACADGSFLTGVDASYYSLIESLSWTCSDGDTIGSSSSYSTADGSALFSIGITGVETGIQDGPIPVLADMYFLGYDIDYAEADGMSAWWKGPFGVVQDGYDLLSTRPGSYCYSGEFATGVTVYASSNFVYGVTLECATVTDTCAPPNYPTSVIEDESSYISSDDWSTYVNADDGSTRASADDESSFPSSDDGPSSTNESSSDSTNKVIAIAVSVGGALVLIAIVLGMTVCCFCRRGRDSEKPHHETQNPAAAGPAGGIAMVTISQGGAGVSDNEATGTTNGADKGVVPHPLADVRLPPTFPQGVPPPLPPRQNPGFVSHPPAEVRPPPTCPPMPDAEPPNSYSQEAPPPAYYC